MNKYVKNLNRIEFVVTFACTGRCKHCSQGKHSGFGEPIGAETAAKAVRAAARHYAIDSVMTFGGEPLLYPETVYAIHSAALAMGIPKRQLITNGFFSRNRIKIKEVAETLAQCGVNEVLLSADAFHQETIPLAPVKKFAEELRNLRVCLHVHPAWLVQKDHENPYNVRTKEILAEFEAMGISPSSGNVILPRGNALRYLSGYYDMSEDYSSPYEENPQDIHAICISPNGDVLNGNIYKTELSEILETYAPCADPV